MWGYDTQFVLFAIHWHYRARCPLSRAANSNLNMDAGVLRTPVVAPGAIRARQVRQRHRRCVHRPNHDVWHVCWRRHQIYRRYHLVFAGSGTFQCAGLTCFGTLILEPNMYATFLYVQIACQRIPEPDIRKRLDRETSHQMDQLNVGKCDPWPAVCDKREEHRLIPFKWYESYEMCNFWCQSFHCGAWSRKSDAYRLFPSGTCNIFRATGRNWVLGLGSCASASLSVSSSSGALDWSPKIRSIEWLRKTRLGCFGFVSLRWGLMAKVAELAMTHKPDQMIATTSGKYRSIDALQSRRTGCPSKKYAICWSWIVFRTRFLNEMFERNSAIEWVGMAVLWLFILWAGIWLVRFGPNKCTNEWLMSGFADHKTSSLSSCTCKWRQWWHCLRCKDCCCLLSSHFVGSYVH